MGKGIKYLNMYVTIFFSVTIVLFFIGFFCIITLSAHNLVTTIKSKTSFTVVLSEDADSLVSQRLNNLLDYAPFCTHYKLISKTETLIDYQNTFGDDVIKVLGYNPFADSYEIFLKPQYVNPDSVRLITEDLKKLSYVDDILVNDSIFSLFGNTFNKIIWILIAITFMLLLISEVLIINTIRLQIYSKRFIISTMKLVGATSWKIKKPFVKHTFILGIFAFILTMTLLSLLFFYCKHYLGILLFPLNVFNIGILCFIVLFASIFITTVTSSLACNKYIRLNSSSVYEI